MIPVFIDQCTYWNYDNLRFLRHIIEMMQGGHRYRIGMANTYRCFFYFCNHNQFSHLAQDILFILNIVQKNVPLAGRDTSFQGLIKSHAVGYGPAVDKKKWRIM